MLREKSLTVVATVLPILTVCILSFGLRIFVRIRNKNWGHDDTAMTIGAVLFTATCIITIFGAYNYIGTHTKYITSIERAMNGAKSFFIFQILIIFAALFIRYSICIALLRITTIKLHRRVIWSNMIIVSIVAITVISSVSSWCTPVRANWNPFVKDAKCKPLRDISIIIYVCSALFVISDWVLGAMPVLILWKVQLSWRSKATVIMLLGLGVCASISTLFRIKYVAQVNEAEILYTSAPLILATILEAATGLFAGSVSTLRPLFSNLLKDRFREDQARRNWGLRSVSARPAHELSQARKSDRIIVSQHSKDATTISTDV